MKLFWWGALLFGVFLYLQLYVAHRAWRRSRGREAGEIDLDYVRIEDFFGRSFRRKLREWLQSPFVTSLANGDRIVWKLRESIRETGSLALPAGAVSEEVLAVHGDLTTGAGCRFYREVWVSGEASLGAGGEFQAIAADRALKLGPGCRVLRWVDCRGDAAIADGVTVGSKLSCAGTVRLGYGVSAEAISAERILTGDSEPAAQPPSSADCTGWTAFADPDKISALSRDTWMYSGDLIVEGPLHVSGSLVVTGNFSCGPGSLIEGALRADGWMRVGPRSWCGGHLVSGGDLTLETGCQFSGLLQAGGTLHLSEKVLGRASSGPVAALSAGPLTISSGVTVYGKLASSSHVVSQTVPTGAGERKEAFSEEAVPSL